MEDFIIEPFLHPDNSNQFINTKNISDLLSVRSAELFKPHKTRFNCIHLFYEGSGVFTLDFKELEVKEKHILFVSTNQISQFHAPVTYKSRVLIFTDDFLCKSSLQTQFFGQASLFNDPLSLPYFELGDRFEEISSLFTCIEKELKRPYNEIQTTILNNYLFNILLMTESRSGMANISLDVCGNKILVSKFKSLVNKNLYRQNSLEHYSYELGVGLRSLQNAFLQVEKQSPKQWLINRMILEIKRNLMYNEMSISEIAYQLGFKEVTNFTKFFKSKEGITPTEFRKEYHR
ncbi:AraC family transcriptional regulator [Chryseobacterium flavum]|uniref:AraC family transcriptional regulator n=1 Tax=Chryseobacterium flavum TaxID=415851 RepID=UPI0028A61CF5|nr:helix-turn-helix domain-containing protein [Chryseobacterium flavum]